MKILIIVNGLGLGNSTRCMSVINYLKTLGLECDVLCSGMAQVFFEQNKSDVSKLHVQKSLCYSNKDVQHVSFWRFFLTIPRNIGAFVSNIKTQYKILKHTPYDLVVSDSDYSIFFLHMFVKFKFAAINNSLNSIKNQVLLSKEERRKVRFHLFVEKVDYFLHRWFTDLTICPTLVFNSVQSIEGVRVVSPICRDARPILKNESLGSIKLLIMISGCKSFDQKELKQKIAGLKGVEKRVLYPDENQKLSNNVQDILWCDMMVTNAGFSSLSESVEFCRPTIVIPLESHSEQLINAKFYANQKFGLHSSAEGIEDALTEMVGNLKTYNESLLKNKKDYRGDRQAGNLLIELMDFKNANLC